MNQTSFLPSIPDAWQSLLLPELQKPYFKELEEFLANEYRLNKTIFPSRAQIFSALKISDLHDVKVVILGQDPYHGAGQAHGLSFSVPMGQKIPPSLNNIFKEIYADLGFPMPQSGYLLPWAQQGVLLLNSVLTVEQGLAGSHQGRGWEIFTDRIISLLSEQQSHIVFMLWGAYAQKKSALIDKQKHCVLEAVHPSPLSAHRGFLGCRHFSQANAFLQAHQRPAIDWRLATDLF